MRAIHLGALLGAVVLVPSTAHAQFNDMRLDSTMGRVGYHISIGYPLTVKSDLPKGNSGGAISGTCRQYMDNLAYQGELPPGVKFVNQGDVVLSGTPRQPGMWRGALSLTVYCSGGPDLNRYQRTIPITWQIEP